MRALLLALLLVLPPTASGRETGDAPAPAKKASSGGKAPLEEQRLEEEAARAYFTDTEVVDHQGRRHRFYSDLMKGRIVLINFAFATCTTACSPITANLAKVQRQLEERVGRDVWMLTVTVDPVNDTPQALAAFAQKFKAQPGWLFLTGSPENVTALLRKLGAYTEKKETHSTALLIGDTRTGNWVKTVAMEKPERIVEAVRHLNTPLPTSAQ
jgi:protein SCO1/2